MLDESPKRVIILRIIIKMIELMKKGSEKKKKTKIDLIMRNNESCRAALTFHKENVMLKA